MKERDSIEPYNEDHHPSHRNAYLKAKKRVDELKGFYWHLFWYIAVNLFISIGKITRNLNNGETFSEAFFDFGTFAVWMFWGIGIFFHAIGVFGKNLFFGKAWEERKVREYMEKEKQNWE